MPETLPDVSASAPRATRFLERLDDGDREAVLAIGATRSYPASSILMFQGEIGERLLLLLAGRVKVTRSVGGEHELMLAIRDPGELLGELTFIDAQPRLATVTALEPVHALVLESSTFRAHLQASPRVSVALLEAVAARFREATVKRLELAATDTLGRLASRITELAERYGQPASEGVLIEMPISHEELASWTGASRAGVAHALQTMRELGWLTTERHRITLCDPEAVRARAI